MSSEPEDEKTWEEVLRRMLPVGAPLPDEEQFDYSIAVEYQGPLVPYDIPKIDPIDVDSVSVVSIRSSSIVSVSELPSSIPVADPIVSKVSRFHRVRNGGGFGKEMRSPTESWRSSSVSRAQFGSPPDSEVDDSDSGIVPKPVIEGKRAPMGTFNTPRDLEIDEDDDDDDDCTLQRSSVADAAASPVAVRSGENGLRKRGVCSRCEKGNRLKEREACIVCNARYCSNCLIKAMGSMPEGRKCVSCIGQPIDESKRLSLGKCSRMLLRLCNTLEIGQMMKAEKECSVNQLRPEQLVVNGRQLRQEELAEVLGCRIPPQKLKPGKYWYDKDSGFWGKEGEKPDRFISSKLNVGGKLQSDASNGDTKVYINGREITKLELRILKLANIQCPRDTHFWVYDDGSYEKEGQNNIIGNIWQKATTRFVCSLFSLPVPCRPPRFPDGPKDDAATVSGRSGPEYLEQGRVQKRLLFGLEGSGTSTIFKQPNFQDVRTRSSIKNLIGWWNHMKLAQPIAKTYVDKAGFGPFLDALWNEQWDRQSLFALSELWWDTTNTFHFSFGEMTMTPKDFSMITGLSMKGKRLDFYEGANVDGDYALSMLGIEIEVNPRGVWRTWLFNTFSDEEESAGANPEYLARAFLLYMLSCTLFVGANDMAQMGYLACMEDMSKIGKYNWGGAALATMYRSMSDMSRGVSENFGGLPFVWEIWYYEYLGLCRPVLDSELMEWPMLKNYAPSCISIRASNRHNYAYARAFLASLTADLVEWDPWRLWETRLSKRCVPCLELTALTGKRVLFEGPSGRYWYLGERVLRQVKGRVDAAMTPVMPPANMRHTNSLDGDALVEAMVGWDANEFTLPNIDYMTFCQQYLMKPRVTCLLPQGGQQARGHSSIVGSSIGMTHSFEEGDMEGSQPQPLPTPNWFVDLCSGMDFVKTPITHPAFDETPRIDPSHEHVPVEYAQEYIELSEGLRRDLLRMSLANCVLEARLNPSVPSSHPPQPMQPKRTSHSSCVGAGPSRKRRTIGNR